MGKIVQYQPQPQPQALSAPSFSMSDMERVALAIAKGGLFGSSDPNAVLTLCMLAQAEGQHPAVVFRDYHIISGKPAKKAEAMQRDFLSAGGRIEWHKLDDNECSATFSHPQGGSATISWDKNRVAQAELGGNNMHKKYPRQMLRSRVISEGVRTVFPMATSGLYESGEVQDMVGQDGPRSDAPPTPVAQRARDLTPIEAPKDDPAAKWASQYIAKLATLTTPTDLGAFVDSKASKLAELESKLPDLHGQVTGARDARAAALSEAGPFDDDTPHPASATADRILTQLEKVETVIDLDKLRLDCANDMEAMPDEMSATINGAFDGARVKLGGGK